MAKSWKPTEKQLSAYDELSRRQNEVRRFILKKRREAEATGRLPSLPSLVVPKRAVFSNRINWRKVKREQFLKRMRELRALYGKGTGAILKRFKDGFLEAYERALGEMPEGRNGRYTPEQIRLAGNDAEFMNLYNTFKGMGGAEFFDRYEKGYIVQFKYIYQEMTGTHKENSFLDEQLFLNREYRRQLGEAKAKQSRIGYESIKGSKVRDKIIHKRRK